MAISPDAQRYVQLAHERQDNAWESLAATTTLYEEYSRGERLLRGAALYVVVSAGFALVGFGAGLALQASQALSVVLAVALLVLGLALIAVCGRLMLTMMTQGRTLLGAYRWWVEVAVRAGVVPGGFTGGGIDSRVVTLSARGSTASSIAAVPLFLLGVSGSALAAMPDYSLVAKLIGAAWGVFTLATMVIVMSATMRTTQAAERGRRRRRARGV